MLAPSCWEVGRQSEVRCNMAFGLMVLDTGLCQPLSSFVSWKTTELSE